MIGVWVLTALSAVLMTTCSWAIDSWEYDRPVAYLGFGIGTLGVVVGSGTLWLRILS